MRRTAGFSLLELLIVVVIVAAVSAAVLPRLILSRLDRNQALAVRNLQEIRARCDEMAPADGQRLNGLQDLVKAGRLDVRYLSSRGVEGYRYLEGPVAGTGREGVPPVGGIVAQPLTGHGRYVYAVSADRIVRYQAAAPGFSLPRGVQPGDPVPAPATH